MSFGFKKKWVSVLILGIMLFVAAFLCVHVFSFTSVSQRLFVKRVQKSLTHQSQAIHRSMESFYYCIDNDSVLTYSSISSFLPDDIDALIFSSDSLLFWSSNQIEPKVIRKRVPLFCDTLVHFGCGDYLISSAAHGAYQCYFYSLINTNYPIENHFFVNQFQAFDSPRDVRFLAHSEPGASPVYSSSGQVIAYFVSENASSLGFSKLGWLIGCLMLLFFCAYLLLYRAIVRFRFHTLSNPFALWFAIISLFLLFLAVVFGFPFLYRYGFSKGFFIPLSISLDPVFLLYFGVLLLFLSCLFGLKALFTHILYHKKQVWLPFLFYLVSVVLASLLLHLHWLIPLMGVLIGALFVLFSRFRFIGDVLFLVVQIMLWGVLFTDLYDQEYTLFENEEIKSFAVSLADERDPDFELSYQHFLEDVQHDSAFFAAVLSDDIMDEVALDYMRSFLFDSVMNQYHVKLTLCGPGAELEVQPEGLVSDCRGYFQEQYERNHGIDLNEGLCFLDYHSLDPSYLSMIDLVVNDTVPDLTLFLEFSKPVAPQVFGLPGLLQSGSGHAFLNPSVAVYQDSLLVYKIGSYTYPNFLIDYRHRVNDFSYGKRMKHYTYQSAPSKLVAVTVERRSSMATTTPFVFFFFFLLVLLLLITLASGVKSSHIIPRTLSGKFQMMVLLALGISFPLVGTISVFYMNQGYAKKASDFHFERTRSLLRDISSEVDFSFLRQPGFHYELDRIIQHYSETFFTDINIYGLDGKLLATTCPEIQDMHLQAALMNAEAFQNMHGERLLYYFHDEQLGDAVYQSAYITIQDDAGKAMAYLNTPYFSSRSELRAEIVTFVLAYINIILLIILLVFSAVLLITRQVTYPLEQLQEKMREVDLNKSNELLEWTSNDEIGTLVKQYNQLVLELEKSAAELRRTATESAWRGVARQVAHEIKNSLTPMRLSLQMLQRSIERGADDVNERVMRTSNTLIEQIDALSDIASSFSTYAKLPENHPQPLDLAELVGNVVRLYDHFENISFRFEYDSHSDFTFHGDKTNLNSAVGNIVKNATQAIGSKPNGQIEVMLQAAPEIFRIIIRDNGKGIKEEDKKMIFLPNFTTKSGGSGVGLSLTFNIIHSAGGTISFESEEGKGTSFVIVLPRNAISS
jgi:signal transduction histidine kinase